VTVNLIKRNKNTIIYLIVCTVILLLGIFAYKWLFPNAGMPVYGDRLEGIDNVKITATQLKETNNKLKENEQIEDVTSNVSGKIVNFTIKVVETLSIEDAKKLTDLIMPEFNEDQVDYYDFQVFIQNENIVEVEAEDSEDKETVLKNMGYILIGYKEKNMEGFKFNNTEE